MSVKSYKDLQLWQKSVDLVEDIYRITALFPKEEQYGLTSQLRRAAVSLPSNIAEGSARNSTKELMHFLAIASGSLAEIETQIEIARRLHFLEEDAEKLLIETLTEIGRMLRGLYKKLESKLL